MLAINTHVLYRNLGVFSWCMCMCVCGVICDFRPCAQCPLDQRCIWPCPPDWLSESVREKEKKGQTAEQLSRAGDCLKGLRERVLDQCLNGSMIRIVLTHWPRQLKHVPDALMDHIHSLVYIKKVTSSGSRSFERVKAWMRLHIFTRPTEA